MANPTNPLWQVYHKLWQLLESDGDFVAAVGDHTVKYTDLTDRRPKRDVGLTADFPRVELAPAGLSAKAHRTSNGSSLLARWAVIVHVGDQRLDQFFDVTFPIYKALANWQSLLDETFTYDQGTFHVCRCKLLNSEDVAPNVRSSEGPKGWSCVWAGETEIWFNSTELTS